MANPNVSDSLPKDKMDIAMAHEVGHAIDALSDQIPTKGLEDELDFNYSALRTGEERKFVLSRPQDFGYKGEMVEREKIAEAIRAYLVDPNYLKTVAPKTAARIRQFVADSPDLANIIQFNGLAAGGAVAGAAAGQSNNAEAGEDPARQRKDGLSNSAISKGPLGVAGAHDFDQLTEALVRRGLAPRPSRSQPFNDLVRALLDREARRKPPSHGGPR